MSEAQAPTFSPSPVLSLAAPLLPEGTPEMPRKPRGAGPPQREGGGEGPCGAGTATPTASLTDHRPWDTPPGALGTRVSPRQVSVEPINVWKTLKTVMN